jgi:integrase
MRKTATRLTKVRINGARYWCVVWPKVGKGRNRRFFKSTGRSDDEGKREAETFLRTKLIEQQNYGTAGMAFTEKQRAEYIECAEKLMPFGKTIRDAIAFYLPHLQATNRSCTAVDLVGELLKVKAADGASERYLSDLKSRLGQFAADFDGKPVAEITSTEVDRWLRSLNDSETGKLLAPTTRNNFRRVLIVAFNFARERGYCIGNPAQKSAKAKEIESEVGILTVEQTAALLEHSPTELLAYVAIGAFAGLRRAELERLDWHEVDLTSGLIEVVATKAKSARRRFIKIQPNLSQWLTPHAQRGGKVTPVNFRKLLDTARAAAGIEDWPQNALRHGFASYHLASFNNAAALALELGHTNSDLVFQHYRQLVKPKQAERYWRLAPDRSGGKVLHLGAAA